MKVAIIGSSEFTDYAYLKNILDCYLKAGFIEKIITSDDSQGTTVLAKRYAKANELECQEFKAYWERGKSAGHIRNKNIINNCDIMIIFRIGVGSNKGIDNAIEQANNKGRDIVICEYESPDVIGL